MATKKVQAKAQKAPARKQAPSNKHESFQAHLRSKSASKGWETRRKNANMPMFGQMVYKMPEPSGRGVITTQAEANETKAAELQGALHNLLNNMVSKLGESGIPVSTGEQIKGSDLQILGSLQRAEETIYTCLSIVERIDNLQKEML